MHRKLIQASHLDTNRIHVWQVNTDGLEAATVARLHNLLNKDEIAKIERMGSAQARSASMLSRGLLRELLGNYLGCDPAQIQFSHGEHGKPELAGTASLQFNLSHTKGMIVFAFARQRRVGIDVECLQRKLDYSSIAERFFSPAEFSALMALPRDEQRAAFMHYWVCKEAYVKARGEGLRYGLARVEISILPEQNATLLADHNHPEEITGWHLQRLNLAPSYTGALAAEGRDWHLECYDYPSTAFVS